MAFGKPDPCWQQEEIDKATKEKWPLGYTFDWNLERDGPMKGVPRLPPDFVPKGPIDFTNKSLLNYYSKTERF